MRKFITAVFILSIMGCVTEQVMTTGKQYSATNPEQIVIYHSKKPQNQYEEIGRISVDKYNNFAISRTGDEIEKLLRKKAASIGGDAVISLSENLESISGIVIKIK